MPKPTEIAPWATNANYPNDSEPEANTPTKVEPDVEETIGWRPGKKPPAQKMNWWQNVVGQWIAYLNAGVWEDDLHVTGALEIDGPALFNSTATFDTVEVGNYIDSPDYFLSAPRTMLIPPSMYMTDSDGTSHITFSSTSADRWQMGNGNTKTLCIPVQREVGDRITGFTVYAFKQSDATCMLKAELVRRNAVTGARTVIATATNNINNPGAITLTAVGLTETCSTPNTYLVEVTQNDATPSGPNTIFATIVTYDRPSP
jgi:hypothetical protein